MEIYVGKKYFLCVLSGETGQDELQGTFEGAWDKQSVSNQAYRTEYDK